MNKEKQVGAAVVSALTAEGQTAYRLVNPSDETRDLIIANGGIVQETLWQAGPDEASLPGLEISPVVVPKAWDIHAGVASLHRVMSIVNPKTRISLLTPGHLSLLFDNVNGDRVLFIVPDKTGLRAILERRDCGKIQTIALPCRSDMLALSDVLLLATDTASCYGCGEVQHLNHLATVGTQQLCSHCVGQLEAFEISTLQAAIRQVKTAPEGVLTQTTHFALDALCAYFDDAAYDDGSGEYAEPQHWRWCDAIADTAIPEDSLKDFITFVQQHGWEHYSVSEQDAEGFHLFSSATQTSGYRDMPAAASSADMPVDEIPF